MGFGTSSGSSRCRLAAAGLVAIISMVGAGPAAAQTPVLGVVAGLSRSEINVSGNEGLNVAIRHAVGAVGGLFVAKPVASSTWLRADVAFVQANSRLDLTAGTTRLRLTYLEIPVMLGYSGPGDRTVRLRLFGGAYAAYLLSVRARSDAGNPSASDLRDAFRSFDAGWIFGLGLDLGRAQLDARYNGGLVNIARQQDLGGLITGPVPDELKYRNRRFAVVVSVPF